MYMDDIKSVLITAQITWNSCFITNFFNQFITVVWRTYSNNAIWIILVFMKTINERQMWVAFYRWVKHQNRNFRNLWHVAQLWQNFKYKWSSESRLHNCSLFILHWLWFKNCIRGLICKIHQELKKLDIKRRNNLIK